MIQDPLLDYYRRELDHVYDRAPRFAARHAKIAEHLGISREGGVEDPHVERLIQAFAYLTARTRRKLDDEFPEITDGLLEVLYPHYLRPIPSMAIVQLHFDRKQKDQTRPHRVPLHAPLRTQKIDDVACSYRTTMHVDLWPLEVRDATLAIVPETGARQERALLDISIAQLSSQGSIAGLEGLETLRFYINDESPHNTFELYELLLNRGEAVTVGPEDADPESYAPCELSPVGFAEEDALFPNPPQSAPGYRLLTEYFAFPYKFLFFDVTLPKAREALRGQRVRLRFHLGKASSHLVNAVTKDTFRLGCTPVVNLFERKSPPATVRVQHVEPEYPVVPEPSEHFAHEVYSVDRVVGVHDHDPGREVEYLPFYSFKHGARREEQRTFWYATRRSSLDDGLPGSDLFLTFVDLDLRPALRPRTTVAVETTCLNRDLPERLGVKPRFALVTRGLVSEIECLRPPTPTRRPFSRTQMRWRVLSHLALNHAALAPRDNAPDVLQELLGLYDIAESPSHRQRIRAIKSVKCSRGVARLVEGDRTGFALGLDFEIVFDGASFSDQSLFLFASILDQFLRVMCPINSFTRLTARIEGSETPLCRWPARSGGRSKL